MNNNGQVMFFTFMLALTVLVLALALAFPVKEAIDNATNYTNSSTVSNLDCNNASISTFDKGTCIVADLSMFYFIGGLIFLAGTILAARVLL